VTSSEDQRKQDHRCAHQHGPGEVVEESHRAAAIEAGEVPRYRRAKKTEAPKDPGSNRRPTDPCDLWDPANVGFGRPPAQLGQQEKGPSRAVRIERDGTVLDPHPVPVPAQVRPRKQGELYQARELSL
jgi:hypothetical protein